MTTENMIRALENVAKEYNGKPVYTGQTNIPIMCHDVISKLKELAERSKWHTGTPTEEGWYLVKYPLIYETEYYEPNKKCEFVDYMWQKIAEGEEVNGRHTYKNT